MPVEQDVRRHNCTRVHCEKAMVLLLFEQGFEDDKTINAPLFLFVFVNIGMVLLQYLP